MGLRALLRHGNGGADPQGWAGGVAFSFSAEVRVSFRHACLALYRHASTWSPGRTLPIPTFSPSRIISVSGTMKTLTWVAAVRTTTEGGFSRTPRICPLTVWMPGGSFSSTFGFDGGAFFSEGEVCGPGVLPFTPSARVAPRATQAESSESARSRVTRTVRIGASMTDFRVSHFTLTRAGTGPSPGTREEEGPGRG